MAAENRGSGNISWSASLEGTQASLGMVLVNRKSMGLMLNSFREKGWEGLYLLTGHGRSGAFFRGFGRMGYYARNVSLKGCRKVY